ncbi:MAG: ElyC/SanA/YdcF family protein [Bacillota bacterium]
MKDKRNKTRRIRRAALAIAAAALALSLGINALMLLSVQDRILTPEQAAGLDADCVLVLGAGVREGRLSAMLADRLKRGVELFEGGASNRMLMSGDHGRVEYDEVNAMKRYAVEQGVPSECVFMDHAGFSTYESMARAKKVFLARKVVIVTQGFHLPRAIYLANALGLDAYGVAADLRPYAGQARNEAREALARVKDFFYALVQPPPTYLGEAIPVSGNGDATNDLS